MDSAILPKLFDLFKSNNQIGIMEICDPLLVKAPGDIELLYCATTAAYITGNTKKGFDYFKEFINFYNRLLTQPNPDRHVMLFLGISVLQIAEMAENHHEENKAEICKSAVTIARHMAQYTGENQLSIMAETMGSRIVESKSGAAYIRHKSPPVLQIETTNHCNLKCTMCPRSSMTRKKGFMDMALWIRILEGWRNKKIADPSTHLVFNTPYTLAYPGGMIKSFFMGEPLLHPAFDVMIHTAKASGARVVIQTNGVLLHQPDIRYRLLNARPDGIAISLDGLDGNTYNTIRKGSDWERILASIKLLHRERTEMGLTQSVVINISTIFPEETKENVNRALAFLDPVRPYVDYVKGITLDRSFDPVFFKGANNAMQKYIKKPSQALPVSRSLCDEPLEKLNILWDGTVTPCCHDIDGQMKLGDATQDRIDDIWQGDQVKSLHLALLNHDIQNYPLCQACKSQA
ncbi:MAG: radical SAM protein [Proteobacteria bacterium]|nr:radical SAM protein [Pseudomonadota bacterium]